MRTRLPCGLALVLFMMASVCRGSAFMVGPRGRLEADHGAKLVWGERDVGGEGALEVPRRRSVVGRQTHGRSQGLRDSSRLRVMNNAARVSSPPASFTLVYLDSHFHGFPLIAKEGVPRAASASR